MSERNAEIGDERAVSVLKVPIRRMSSENEIRGASRLGRQRIRIPPNQA